MQIRFGGTSEILFNLGSAIETSRSAAARKYVQTDTPLDIKRVIEQAHCLGEMTGHINAAVRDNEFPSFLRSYKEHIHMPVTIVTQTPIDLVDRAKKDLVIFQNTLVPEEKVLNAFHRFAYALLIAIQEKTVMLRPLTTGQVANLNNFILSISPNKEKTQAFLQASSKDRAILLGKDFPDL